MRHKFVEFDLNIGLQFITLLKKFRHRPKHKIKNEKKKDAVWQTRLYLHVYNIPIDH